MKNVILIAVAGAAGTLSRYGLSTLVSSILGSDFPWGTFIVNIVGCFLFGLIWSLEEHHLALGPQTRVIILTGFMGAFTTFSTFIFENNQLLSTSQWIHLSANLVLQILIGLAALAVGIHAARLVL
ncbi:MAG: fluoride efflux transporter CrcB [Candidatus Hinthialibacter antarcticus]|nr:fluoride efflux transporter CrcB [Candidatus Hinthialibacter antarcticus]